MELANTENGRYQSKLKQDVGVILLLLGLLYFSEIFMAYTILTTIWDSVPELSSIIWVYILFISLLLGIETMGCIRVYKSIKEHMFEFEYYD